jgi:hypothetical protein
MLEKYLFFLMLGACLISCNTSQKIDTSQIVKVNDSQFIKKIYRDNGSLFIEQEFKKDKMGNENSNGFHKEYYLNGKLSSLSFYKMGTIDSIRNRYYENGKILGEYYYTNGHPFGDWIEYYADGKIRSVTIYGDSILYSLKYNRDGTIKSNGGIPILVIPFAKSVRVGDTLTIVNSVVNSKDFNSKLTVDFSSLYTKQKSHFVVTEFDIVNSQKAFYYHALFDSPGKWAYQVEVELTDKSGQLIKRGIERDTFTVVK